MSVYAWGTGTENGELGTGELETKLEPTPIEGFKSARITKIAAGDSTVLCVTDNGDVYSFGRNREGQLGTGSKEKFCATPQKIMALASERIVEVAAGGNHSIAITSSGDVYHWGRLHHVVEAEKRDFDAAIAMPGMREMADRKRRMLDRSIAEYYANGQDLQNSDDLDTYNTSNLNFGNFKSYIQRTPKLLEGLGNVRIVKAAAGYGFSLLLSSTGQVYSYGFNDKLQLGLGHRYSQHKPQLVKALAHEYVVQVACGQQHSLALTRDGDVYSWGLGVFGQLGHDSLSNECWPKKIIFTHPTNPKEEIKIVQVACGAHHSLALDSKGRVWSWGSSEYAQQFQSEAKYYDDWGTAERQGNKQNYYYSVPRLIVNGFDNKIVTKICCGALHNLAITEDGEVYSWGWGANGALGHGNKRFQLFPVVINMIKGEKVVAVAAGAKSSYAVIASDDSCFAFDFKKFIDNPTYSDITFVVQGGREIHAHKVIVFYRCPYLFKSYLLQNRFGYYKGDTFYVSNVEHNVFLAFLRYLYTDHLKAPSHLLRKLEALARRYRLPRLAALCRQQLSLRIITESAIPPSTFKEDMKAAVNDPHFADIHFQLGDNVTIHAHRVLLSARSDYFHTIFEAAFKERGQSFIPLQDIKEDVFTPLLTYLYTNEIDITGENIVDLLLCSDRFLVHDMKSRVEKELEDAMDLENVVDLLMISDQTSTPRLRKACVSMLVDNMDFVKSRGLLADLRKVSATLVRELDYLMTKKYMTKPGELLAH